jgi:DeoR/GlpR family transcriptional regulator of sugar metabolism
VVVDLALVGVDGVSVEHGVTSFHPGQAYVTRRLTERAKEVWVVADHSKLGAVRPAVIAPLSAVHKLITDSVLSDDALRPFREAGVEVIRS